MTLSASSYVVSFCTIFELWRLLRRLAVVFSGRRFSCVLRLVCGGTSSNLRRRFAAADEWTFAAVLVAAAYLIACCSYLRRRLV